MITKIPTLAFVLLLIVNLIILLAGLMNGNYAAMIFAGVGLLTVGRLLDARTKGRI